MTVQDQTLKYEDLLETVRESERGRWFLSEFENRLRRSQTTDILAAIQRLEATIAEQKSGHEDSALVARARTAIAAARREIANIDRQALSDEGRLFAKLADMARTAFASEEPGKASVTSGISRALLLVDQLDQDFSTSGLADAKAGYFPAEAGIFEPVPAPASAVPAAAAPTAPAPKAIVAPAKPVPQDIERGAKLVIRKAGEQVAPAAEPPAPAAEAQPPQTAIAAAVPEPAATPPAKSRVVIIRRKPEELLDVPLVDEGSASNAA